MPASSAPPTLPQLVDQLLPAGTVDHELVITSNGWYLKHPILEVPALCTAQGNCKRMLGMGEMPPGGRYRVACTDRIYTLTLIEV